MYVCAVGLEGKVDDGDERQQHSQLDTLPHAFADPLAGWLVQAARLAFRRLRIPGWLATHLAPERLDKRYSIHNRFFRTSER